MSGEALASQCLALCQTLASQGQAFTININIHNIFTFSMESKENIPANQGKDKKKSPSTIRRDLLRRQKFLKSKTDQVQTARLDVPAASSEPVTTSITFKCDHCDFIGESKSLVDKHMETIHKEIQCEYCELKILSVNSMKTHVQSGQFRIGSFLFVRPIQKGTPVTYRRVSPLIREVCPWESFGMS